MTFLRGNEVFGLDPLLIILKANATPAATSTATSDPLATSSSVILLFEILVKSRISPLTLLEKKKIYHSKFEECHFMHIFINLLVKFKFFNQTIS